MGKLAINAKLYRNTASYEAPSWSEVTLIGNLRQGTAWKEAPADARESRVEQVLKSMLGLEWTGQLKKKPGNANYEAFMDAALSEDALDLLILDGDKDTENVRGWRVDALIFDNSEDQALPNTLYQDLRIKPYVADHAALAVKVAAGPTLTYSAPGPDGGDFE